MLINEIIKFLEGLNDLDELQNLIELLEKKRESNIEKLYAMQQKAKELLIGTVEIDFKVKQGIDISEREDCVNDFMKIISEAQTEEMNFEIIKHQQKIYKQLISHANHKIFVIYEKDVIDKVEALNCFDALEITRGFIERYINDISSGYNKTEDQEDKQLIEDQVTVLNHVVNVIDGRITELQEQKEREACLRRLYNKKHLF